MKYSVVPSRKVERTKAKSLLYSFPPVWEACQRIEEMIPRIQAWIERVNAGENWRRFPVGGELKSELFRLQEKNPDLFSGAKRMTAFIECTLRNTGEVDAFFLVVEVFTNNGRLKLPTVSFTNSGDYLSYAPQGSILETK